MSFTPAYVIFNILIIINIKQGGYNEKVKLNFNFCNRFNFHS